MKKAPAPPIAFASNKEVEEYEKWIREAHNQYDPNEVEEKKVDETTWKDKKPPGIMKRLIPLLLPDRSRRKKQKL